MLSNCDVREASWESLGLHGDQTIVKEINPEYSLEGLMQKLQYFGHLMRRTDSLEKTPDAGKDWGQEEKGTTDGWMASPTRWTWVWASSEGWWWTGKPGVLQSMGSQTVRYDWVTELKLQLPVWCLINLLDLFYLCFPMGRKQCQVLHDISATSVCILTLFKLQNNHSQLDKKQSLPVLIYSQLSRSGM